MSGAAVDAVVIGASTRGVLAAYALSALGYRAVVLERAADVGGGDGSFQLADGTWFDFGMHVLDELRSELATRAFTMAVDGRVHRVKLRRGIVMRNRVLPYAPRPAELPDELRALLSGNDLVDDIGNDPPSRARIADCYGARFADLIFDEVLPSYPSEHRHRAFGVDEAQLLANIYPWFFPCARRTAKAGDASRAFHDRLRAGIDQHILYPRDGGFAEFSRGFLRKCDPARVEVLTGLERIDVVRSDAGQRIAHVAAGGRVFAARRYFWAAGWPELCALFDLPCQNAATDRIVLGSFRLNRPAHTAFHEILVGDPRHAINRIHFPGAYRESDEPLMQIEFAFPDVEARSRDGEHWRTAWLASLRELGILDAGHEVVLFDFKTRKLHFNGYGVEGEPLRDADPRLLGDDGNVFPIVPSMANLNLNAHVPEDIAYVTRVLAREAAADAEA